MTRHVTALVAFHTYRWIRVAIGSFRRHFPEENLVVVDNNPQLGDAAYEEHCGIESNWLRSQSYVTLLHNPSPKKTHGVGLDIAVEWCRANDVSVLVLIEPDCLIRGRQWRDDMVAAIQGGAHMAGYFRKSYGPIHPAPSAWNVSAIVASFDTQPRIIDQQHPRFHELVDVRELQRIVEAEQASWEFWGSYWDSTQKNWFEAAIRDKAILLQINQELDFRHYWCGSLQNRNHEILRSDPELSCYALENEAMIT